MYTGSIILCLLRHRREGGRAEATVWHHSCQKVRIAAAAVRVVVVVAVVVAEGVIVIVVVEVTSSGTWALDTKFPFFLI